jgi:hypothetical protein
MEEDKTFDGPKRWELMVWRKRLEANYRDFAPLYLVAGIKTVRPEPYRPREDNTYVMAVSLVSISRL